jgi:nucleoid-associated protein YgaU
MAGREQQIEQQIRAQGIQVQNLKIEDHDGKVVSIKGTVASADVKAKVEQIAESMPGVKVANHLTVGGSGSGGLLGGQAGGAATAGSTYTVKSGDSLSKIAKQVYGDASKWKLIHEANKAKIPNPDLIHPGDQLTIPPKA